MGQRENMRERVDAQFLLEGIQQAYWVGQSGSLELSVPARYCGEADLPGDDPQTLETALNALIRRHEMLRAVICDNGEQRILASVPFYRPECIDLRGLGAQQAEARRSELRAAMQARDLPPDRWPQFDIRATRDDAGLRLHISFALWMMDGWSFHILLQELTALIREPETDLPEIALRFPAYVEDQRERRAGARRERAWSYWHQRLQTFPGPPALPLSPRLQPGARPTFRHIARTLPKAKWQKLMRICAARRLTPSLLACAAYSEVLARASGSEDFAITLLHSGRFQYLPDAERTIGNFGTTILLEVDRSADTGFGGRARALQSQFLRDVEHMEVSGLDITRALQQRSGAGATIGVPVTFTAVSAPRPSATEPAPAAIRHQVSRLQVPQVHLDHQLHFGPDGSAIFNWDYAAEIFPTGFVEKLSEAHLALMTALAEDEALWDQDDPLARTRPDPAPAAPPALEPQRLEAMFEHQAVSHPERTAIISSTGSISYARLRGRALAVARALSDSRTAPGTLVAVVLDKGWEQVAAVLGILYAGAAYVPVDPDLPDERRALLMKSSGARIALTRKELEARLSWPEALQTIPVDGLDEPAEAAPVQTTTACKTTDLAYVIFTSGSTGIPKGVMIDHRGAWNTIVDLNDRFALKASDRVLALSSLSFDLSVYDIFGTLAAGATIVMPDRDGTRDPAHWQKLVRDHAVTIWNSVPALMQLAAEDAREPVLSSLRLVMLSGDWIPLSLPPQIRIAAPAADICSLGGATEASIWSVLYPIEDMDPEWRSIPYGHAMDHQSIHVLDKELRLCPPWVSGDLYIGGIGVALGYWQDPEKTAANFIIHPRTGERLYRTGDMGRYLADGEIEFLGRTDFQVKIQGYRVECAEVEAALLAMPEVAGAIVSAASDSTGTRHLVAYIVARSATPDIKALRERLRATLPAYMVPAFFMILDRLPLSDNGKVIRTALPAPDFAATVRNTRPYAAPHAGLETEIAALWQDLLAIAGPIGRDDNFFALGGSSFAGMRLMARLEKRCGTTVSFAMLMSHPTIASLADAIANGDGATADDALIVPIRKGNDAIAPLFCIHPIGGNVMCYALLAQSLTDERAIYGVRAPGLTSREETPLSSIAAMAERYLDEIREIRPDGRFHLAGWSLGGLVVQEMARRLDGSPGLLAMIDSVVPDTAPVCDRKRFLHFAADIEAIAGLSPHRWNESEIAFPLSDRIAVLSDRLEEAGVASEAARLETVYRVFEAGSTALERHRPSHSSAPALLFAARLQKGFDRVCREWRELMPQMEIVGLDGDHYSIMRQPCIEAIARRIAQVMEQKDKADAMEAAGNRRDRSPGPIAAATPSAGNR
ncbi:non-ribosomal peptide synthetase [Martelella mediterranea]|uniref:Anguibactin system regulator n=1 Tax=Martelella mediterranea DSM 17316 TaxID=1122214 RepID=A0A1U9Z7V8_9HYPH|nr:non-ribosomal peptide synthetase [Martelella mediterranea]AQZ53662.1 Anguibactin system regulator [Martelella mediterranea DSM 17316]